MESKIKSTYKSDDTEEWLDKVWTRPVGYLWARAFKAIGAHPNVVTVVSMVLGAASSLLFVHGSCHYEGMDGLLFNLGGIVLLSWANFLDSADGQLARMTGQTTRLGRILDGAASQVWFIPIYIALVVRFAHYHTVEFNALGIADTPANVAMAVAAFLLIVVWSGFHSHSRQCAMADYYRQIHLCCIKGQAGSELDTSSHQKQIYDATPWKGNRLWKLFLLSYIGYTRRQESLTPCFQKLRTTVVKLYGGVEGVPERVRREFRLGSLPLMRLANILTFNTRAIVLYICCLADIPWLYFLFEIVVMGFLCNHMVRVHEELCDRMDALLCGRRLK